jgi:hypothetical protein
VESPIPSMTEAEAAAVIAVVAVEGFVACSDCIISFVALCCVDDAGRKASAPGAIRGAKSIVEENFIVVFVALMFMCYDTGYRYRRFQACFAAVAARWR